MESLRKYEIMILLTEEFNDSELKSWVFNYAKNLRKFKRESQVKIYNLSVFVSN